MRPVPLLTVLLLLLETPGATLQGQLLFDWPVRSVPQPEAVLTGAGALFFNPGALSPLAGTRPEVRITHVDGPDATGVRGLSLALSHPLPLGLSGAMGYWHLGIPDIPRTTDSPLQNGGEVEVAEDVLLLGLAREVTEWLSVGGSVRMERASVDGDARSGTEGSVGLALAPELPLRPRVGLALKGLGDDRALLSGVEVSLPPLARGRVPMQAGYGYQYQSRKEMGEHRFSFRASWMEIFHAGAGAASHSGEEEWTPLWMLGLELGRYSFSVLREELANGFGPIHFFRAAVAISPPEDNQ